MNKVTRVFLNTDLRSQHHGLGKVAGRHKVSLEELEPGEHVIFINKKMTRVKLFSANGVLSYYRGTNERINLGVVEMIPQCFNAKGGLDWAKAEKLAVEKQLAKLNKRANVQEGQWSGKSQETSTSAQA